jgi:hypothetical protein
MSDQNINITLSTTGSGQAATDVEKVGTKVEQLGKKTKDTAGQTKNWGMATNALSYQMQDFAVQVGSGTSALTAFSQQAPQLIGGLSMAGVMTGGLSIAMAGLSVAIPIVLMGGRALWTAFAGGAEDARKKTDVLISRFKDVTKIYQDFEDAGKKAREEAAREAEETLRRNLSGIDTRFKISTDATALQGTIETLNTQLKLSRDRLDLMRIESALTMATGEDLLRLTKEREASVQRIYDYEVALAEIARATALEKIRAAATKAAETFDAIKADTETAGTRYRDDAARVDALEAKRLDVQNRSKELEVAQKLTEATGKLNEMQQDAARQGGLRGGADMAAIDRQKTLAAQLEKEFFDLEKSRAQRLADATAQRDAALKTADETKAALTESAKKLEAAAAALTRASLDISNLKRTQAVETKLGGEIKATDEIAKTGQKVTDAAKRAIDAIKNEAAKTGENVTPRRGFPGQETPKSGAIAAIEDLLKDATPDAEQGARLIEILRSLQNGLNQKDATLTSGIESLIAITNGQVDAYKALKTRVEALESKANQSR